VEAGLSPAAALRSATSTAASVIGLEGKVGSISPGAFADLIFIKGDPLANITALDSLRGVMKDGIFVWFNRNGAHPQ